MAIVAAVVDCFGGLRTVVCTRASLHNHVSLGEVERVVPGLTVHEPIAWNDIPWVIERARIELDRWLDTRPNLTADEQHAVALYQLRKLRGHNHRSVHVPDIVET